MFSMYFNLGVEHITDLQGYDHILFIVALCAIFILKDFRQVLILVTAFTLGHSVTLALATLNFIKYSTSLIEFLIPLTIFISAVGDFYCKCSEISKSMLRFKYFSALIFGLIHGMGFSNYLRALLGGEENIFQPLLAFNLGLEAGQIIIVALFLTLVSLLHHFFGFVRREMTLVTAGAAAGISLILMIERFGDLF